MPSLAELISLLTSGGLGLFTALCLGTLFGFVAGLAPGIGGRIGIILFLPIALFWDPLGGAVFLFAMHSVVHTSASIPAIAFALPSTGADAATVIDGYPLSKMGRAGEALGASLSASAIGGVVGALAFLAIIPVARLVLNHFGPPEFLLLALAGLSMVALLSGRNLVTGLLAASIGILIASIGIDVSTSADRFTFGRPELRSGVDIAAIIGGIFVVPEMLAKWSFDAKGRHRAVSTSMSDVLLGMRKTLQHLKLVSRSSLYGIGIGMMPGLGSSVAVWMSYAYASRTSKSKIPFGKGAIEGVIAPEAANNSKEGGAMVPTLFFGIPGSSSMAIMLGAFLIVGLPVGPNLLTSDIQVSYALAATVLLANLIAIPMFFAVVPGIVRLAALRREHIVPFAIALSLFAALYQDMHWVTLAQFMFASAIGIALKRLEWSRAALLLGFIMGPLAEISYIQTSQIWGWSMFERPASLIMLAVFLVFGIRAARSKTKKTSNALGVADGVLACPILIIFILACTYSISLPSGASSVPLLISIIGLVLSGMVSLAAFKMRKAKSPFIPPSFENLRSTLLYCALVPFLGLPLMSMLYVVKLMRKAGTGMSTAVGSALALGIVQTSFLALIMDIWAEPMITGWIYASLSGY
ncbi:MAG: tripartite tricarboxylate transporter permease [Hyphomicrobiales bacterium]